MKTKKSIPASLQLQFYSLIALLALGIYCLIDAAYIIFFEILLAFLFFLMGYNNHKIYHRKYMTVIYITCGILFALIAGLEPLGISILS